MSTKKTPARPVAKTAKPATEIRRTDFFQPAFWQQHALPAAALMAISFIIYGITLGYGYLQDDQLFIWDNIFVQKGFAGLAEIFGNDSLLGYYKDPKLMLEGGRYRPLPLATFAIEIGLFGKDQPGIGHFINVLLYGAVGILLYRVLCGLFPKQEGGIWYFSLPFIAAVIFMLHPLHTEVVANIKSRDEILALLGSLGALWAIMRHFDTGENRLTWLASGFFLLGLLSKENTATFFAVIPLTIYVFSKVSPGQILSACLPLVAAVAIFLLMRGAALEKPMQHAEELVLNPFMGMNLGEKWATIFFSLGWFLKLLFVPWPLTIDYYPYHVPKAQWTDWQAPLSLILYVGMGIWALRRLRQSREGENAGVIAWSILYYLLTISVVSNVFVRTSTFLNERYLFMPSVAFCVLIAWFLTKKWPQAAKKTAERPFNLNALAFGIIAAAFAWICFTRIPDWGGDGTRLVTSAARVSGNSYRANYYYANLLHQMRYTKVEKATDPVTVAARNLLRDSIDYYVSKSLEINPGYRLAAPLKVQMAVARFNQDKDLNKLLQEFEKLIYAQPANGDMLIMVLDVLKSLKGADPNVYNFFCHRVGYSFYYRKMQDPNGGIEFLNLGLNNYPQDQNMIQELIEIHSAMGNQSKVRELQQRAGQ